MVEVLVEYVGLNVLYTAAVAISCRSGYFCLDRLEELREAAVVGAGFVEPVLVADLDVVQRERRGMAVLGALRAPLGVGVAGYVLDFIERILYVGLELGARIDVLLHVANSRRRRPAPAPCSGLRTTSRNSSRPIPSDER